MDSCMQRNKDMSEEVKHEKLYRCYFSLEIEVKLVPS